MNCHFPGELGLAGLPPWSGVTQSFLMPTQRRNGSLLLQLSTASSHTILNNNSTPLYTKSVSTTIVAVQANCRHSGKSGLIDVRGAVIDNSAWGTYRRSQNSWCPIFWFLMALCSRNSMSSHSRYDSYFRAWTNCSRYWFSSESLQHTKHSSIRRRKESANKIHTSAKPENSENITTFTHAGNYYAQRSKGCHIPAESILWHTATAHGYLPSCTSSPFFGWTCDLLIVSQSNVLATTPPWHIPAYGSKYNSSVHHGTGVPSMILPYNVTFLPRSKYPLTGQTSKLTSSLWGT